MSRTSSAVLTAVAFWLAGCRRAPVGAGGAAQPAKAAERPASAATAAKFVGRATCEKCHAEEAKRLRGSHHDLATQPADEKTVIGNFRNASFTHFGVTSTFFRRGGKFYARTDGPEGALHDYEIAYTFGIYPLQQYLIAFPGGRYQALNVCWDLAALYSEQGRPSEAEAEYLAAIQLMPAFGAAYVDLADLYRVQSREAAAERILRQGVAASPRDGGIHHSLGLTLVRVKRLPEAIVELRRAAEISPDDPRFAYVYGMALDAAGDAKGAIRFLLAASARHTGSRSLLEALVSVAARSGDGPTANSALRRLEALSPNDPRTRALLRDLSSPEAPR